MRRLLSCGPAMVPFATVALTSHFAAYLTVYLTVLLVLPFPGPTVAVTRFPVL
jgi:hypothetical protein